MPRNARCVKVGLPYHVTQRGTNRQRVFFSASDRRTYLDLMMSNLEDAEVRVFSWCLMTNHVHFVVVPEREDSMEVLFRRVHGRYAQSLNARRGRSGHLWQNRYYSCALSETHMWRALAYVEQNPVRAGLVGRAEEYEWSSARAHVTGEAGRFKGLDWSVWREAGGLEGWRELIERKGDTREEMLLRRCTYAGRPYGEEEFVKGLEEEFRRSWRRWGFEKKGAEGSKK
jgi:putative transposase